MNLEPESVVDDSQWLVDRLAAAKWITGMNIETPDNLTLTFTPLGVEQLRMLGEAARPMAERGAGLRTRRVTFTEWVRFFNRRHLAVAALSPPAFSRSERMALVALASVQERHWRGE